MAKSDILMKDQLALEDSHPEVEKTSVDSIMSRIFDKARSDVHIPEIGKSTTEYQVLAPRRDFDTAIELLDRVSKAFDLLVTRFQRMQRELEVQNERAAARAAEQDHAIEKWERLALGLKQQVAAGDAALVAVQARCEAAEARADMAEKQAASLETASRMAADQAFQAERLSTKLHDKVVSVFGIGSRAHAVLEAVATSAAE